MLVRVVSQLRGVASKTCRPPRNGLGCGSPLCRIRRQSRNAGSRRVVTRRLLDLPACVVHLIASKVTRGTRKYVQPRAVRPGGYIFYATTTCQRWSAIRRAASCCAAALDAVWLFNASHRYRF